MFFLFVLKEHGLPVSEVFESHIKDLPTTRFSTQFDDEYKHIYFQLRQEKKQQRRESRLARDDGGFGVDRDLIRGNRSERVFNGELVE